ncbi:MAG: TetR/AcrR family transcriptional regulator [Mycobacteriaceae bacterium]|nr:TetR/AcrR family transcriptional regulator [Mycobacteriaceae bacterium]
MSPTSRTSGRERLLAAAEVAFRERGYVSVSMQEIAEAAGVTKGAPYHHFADKEQLLAEVFVRVMERQQQVAANIMAQEAPLRERLIKVVDYLLTAAGSELARLPGEVMQHIAPGRLTKLRAGITSPVRIFELAFERCRDDLGGAPAGPAAQLFVALVLGHIHLMNLRNVLDVESAGEPVSAARIVGAFTAALSQYRPDREPDSADITQ